MEKASKKEKRALKLEYIDFKNVKKKITRFRC